MKPHYFNQDESDQDDYLLIIAKQQEYVPQTCLLGGEMVWALIKSNKDPCECCVCDRIKCNGRSKIKQFF